MCAFSVRSVYRGKIDTFFFSGDRDQEGICKYTPTDIQKQQESQALDFPAYHLLSQSPHTHKKAG